MSESLRMGSMSKGSLRLDQKTALASGVGEFAPAEREKTDASIPTFPGQTSLPVDSPGEHLPSDCEWVVSA